MTDPTSNPQPEDVVHDADGDAVNVEAVNDGESVPGGQPGAGTDGSPSGANDQAATAGEVGSTPSSEVASSDGEPPASVWDCPPGADSPSLTDSTFTASGSASWTTSSGSGFV